MDDRQKLKNILELCEDYFLHKKMYNRFMEPSEPNHETFYLNLIREELERTDDSGN